MNQSLTDLFLLMSQLVYRKQPPNSGLQHQHYNGSESCDNQLVKTIPGNCLRFVGISYICRPFSFENLSGGKVFSAKLWLGE
jgi:hypothetical protein